MIALADQCLSEYDEHGWTGDTWLDPDDVAYAGGQQAAAGGGIGKQQSEAMSWIDQRPDDAMDGAFTAVGPEPVRTVEAAPFRDAMSRLGAAVHVITTAGPGGKTGATATAACSVIGRAADAADVPQPAQPDQSGRAGERRVLRQHAGRGRSRDRRHLRRPHRRDGQRPLQQGRMDDAADRQSGAGERGGCVRLPDRRGALGRRATTCSSARCEAVRLGPQGPALVYHERAYKHL